MYIGGQHLDELQAEPGQFFRWRFLTRGMWWSVAPVLAVRGPPPDVHADHGEGPRRPQRRAGRLRPGTRIIAEGPYGAFTPRRDRRRILLLAGGVGITPLRAMFAALPGGGSPSSTGPASPRDVVFGRELDAIAATARAAVHYLIGSRPGWAGSADRRAAAVPRAGAAPP